jgi:serine/threonine protein kinase
MSLESSRQRVRELLVSWEERRRAGTTTTPEDHCRDCPELLDPFKAELAKLAHSQQFLAATPRGSTVSDPHRTLPPASPLVQEEGAGLDWLAELQSMVRPAEAPDELGRLGHYRLLRRLGAGGMGIVLEAEDVQLKRRVALKVMRSSLASSPPQRTRFLREAQAAAGITNDHIVPIFQVGEDHGVPYLAMALLPGQTLNARLSQGPLPMTEIVRIGREIAQGLTAAHARGLIHRDIKPSNIWLELLSSALAVDGERSTGEHSPPTRVKILDFGLARPLDATSPLTQFGALMGTVGYLAPEQAAGENIDQRVDLFSLGCVLYRMATGRLPFSGSGLLGYLASLATDHPSAPNHVNAEVPGDLSRLIMQLLAKNPAERPGSAAEVARHLRRIEQELATPELRGHGLERQSAKAETAAPVSSPSPRPARPRRQPGGQVWASDANQIGIDDLELVVFKNAIIEDFLLGRGRYFLSANKGLGKTLLLSFKRKQLADAYHEPRQGKSAGQMFFVPEGRPFLDFMGNLHTLPATHVDFLSELGNTKRLWSAALRTSALSHHPSLFNRDDDEESDALPKRLAAWLRGGKVEPTVVFKEMLGYSLKEIHHLIDRRENFLEQKFRQIHSGMFFFIDKVDQGVRSLPRPVWINIQAGLIEAAWDAMNANGHVKIYASIRQEAFSNYESDIKTNLFGATTILQYADAELEHLLDQLTQCYESGKSFKQLIGLDRIRHPWRPVPEDSFHYLRRHTLGRPRDLVIIASEVSRRQRELSETGYRTLVQETAGTMLVPNLFEEMRVFLNCLDDKQERLRFFSLLPHNILTHAEVVRIYYQFNYLDPESPPFDHYSEKLHHPFWELYSAGLLGVVTKPDGQRAEQKFKQPAEIFSDSQAALPTVDFYLIHPALDWFIRKNRSRDDYRIFQHILVGHDCPWPEYYGRLLDIERALFTLQDSGLRDIVHRLLKQVPLFLEAGRSPKEELSQSPEWLDLQRHLPQENDLLFLMLEELIGQQTYP